MALRTGREDGEVLGAVFDYLRWLGVEDVANQWNNGGLIHITRPAVGSSCTYTE